MCRWQQPLTGCRGFGLLLSKPTHGTSCGAAPSRVLISPKAWSGWWKMRRRDCFFIDASTWRLPMG